MKLLTDVLNIEAQEEKTPTVQNLTTYIDKEEQQASTESEQMDSDFNKVRKDVLGSLETAKEAVEYMLTIAKDKEDSKSFEALNGLLKTVVDTSSQLLTLYNKREEYRDRRNRGKKGSETKDVSTDTNISVNNAVFVGTPAELKEYIQKLREAKE